jgi:hypothetical protein
MLNEPTQKPDFPTLKRPNTLLPFIIFEKENEAKNLF